PPDNSSKPVPGTVICPRFVNGAEMVPLALNVPVDSFVSVVPDNWPLMVNVPKLSSPAPPTTTLLLCRMLNVPSFSMPLLGVKWAVNGKGTLMLAVPWLINRPVNAPPLKVKVDVAELVMETPLNVPPFWMNEPVTVAAPAVWLKV